jgi:hypothetical protein
MYSTFKLLEGLRRSHVRTSAQELMLHGVLCSFEDGVQNRVIAICDHVPEVSNQPY